MKENRFIVILCFIFGLILYLSGLFLLFGSSLNKLGFLPISFTSLSIYRMKVIGILLFLVGFFIFMLSIILLYKNNKICDNHRELIIEGKADVITIVVMTYILIFMLVICLLFNEVVGALLFGVAVLVQSLLNTVLIKYFSKRM